MEKELLSVAATFKELHTMLCGTAVPTSLSLQITNSHLL
jgi:hypothetical protein